jgi:NarL family two-component system response regulator LiaR
MTEPNTIRVMLVDDHAVVRSGLSAFLSTFPDLELVGEAGNGDEAIACCERLHPDVILMDLMMPGTDGVTAMKVIHQKYPQVRMIALTSFQENALVERALQAGASGYLMKNVSADELATAIRSAYQGKIVLSMEATEALIHARLQTNEMEQLTDREREVLKLMVEGLNNSQIAERLVVGLSTVKFHVGNILMKLGVENRVAAVTMAMQKKLV